MLFSYIWFVCLRVWIWYICMIGCGCRSWFFSRVRRFLRCFIIMFGFMMRFVCCWVLCWSFMWGCFILFWDCFIRIGMWGLRWLSCWIGLLSMRWVSIGGGVWVGLRSWCMWGLRRRLSRRGEGGGRGVWWVLLIVRGLVLGEGWYKGIVIRGLVLRGLKWYDCWRC